MDYFFSPTCNIMNDVQLSCTFDNILICDNCPYVTTILFGI
jgi:hypothetical protein